MDQLAEVPIFSENSQPKVQVENTENPDIPQPEKETFDDGEKFGFFYESLLNESLGNGEADTSMLASSKEKTKALADSVILTTREHRHKEHLLASVKNMQGVDFMTQAFAPEKLEGAQIDLQELSKGVFAVFLDTDSFSRIYNRDSQAVYVKVPDGVSFVIIRKYQQESEAAKHEREENVPHEVNHLVWNYLKRDGIVQSDEEDPELNKAFQMYQDELAAKLVSDGTLVSYTHLRVISSEALAKLQAEKPDTIKLVTEQQIDLNNILEEITARGGSSADRKKSYLLCLIRSRNFNDLKQGLAEIRDSLPPVEDANSQPTSSWDVV